MVDMKVVTLQVAMPTEMHKRLVELKGKRNWTDFIEEELLTEKIEIPKHHKQIIEKLAKIHDIPLAELYERIRKFSNTDVTCLHFEKIAVENTQYKMITACGLLFKELIKPPKTTTPPNFVTDEQIEEHFRQEAEDEEKEHEEFLKKKEAESK